MGSGQKSRPEKTHVERKTIALRNTYPVGLRQWGMLITVFDDPVAANNKTYELSKGFSSTSKSDNSNWKEFTASTGGSTEPSFQEFVANGVLQTFQVTDPDFGVLLGIDIAGNWQRLGTNYTWNNTTKTADFLAPVPASIITIHYFKNLSLLDLPDWSDTTKGAVEKANQAEAETAADIVEGNRDNIMGLTARAFRWAFNAVWTWIKTQAQTIAGVWTFSASPVVPVPTAADQAASKGYIDNLLAAATNIPGIYFSPGQSFDPTFVVFASAIAKPNGPYVLNDPIVWSILDHTTAHNSSFFKNIAPDSGNLAFKIFFPPVKNVLNGYIKGDESFNIYGVLGCPPSIALDNMAGSPRIQKPFSVVVRGNGSGGWTKRGDGTAQTALDITAFSAGGASFNITGLVYGINYESLHISYNGPNRYTIRRVYSGLGAYNAKFVIVDAAGVDLASNPTTLDEVIISCGAASYSDIIDMYKWRPTNEFMLSSPSFNFWITGWFEAWLVAVAISTTVIQVRWQPTYVGATNYKIYRDTQASFATQVLIHTGTSGLFLDTGRTAGTLYHYKLVAVISGVDTEITTFRTNTKAY